MARASSTTWPPPMRLLVGEPIVNGKRKLTTRRPRTHLPLGGQFSRAVDTDRPSLWLLSGGIERCGRTHQVIVKRTLGRLRRVLLRSYGVGACTCPPLGWPRSSHGPDRVQEVHNGVQLVRDGILHESVSGQTRLRPLGSRHWRSCSRARDGQGHPGRGGTSSRGSTVCCSLSIFWTPFATIW